MARKKTLPLIRDFDNIPEEALVPEAEQPYEIPEDWRWVHFGDLNAYVPRSVDPRKKPESEFTLYSVPAFPDGKPEKLPGKEIRSSKKIVSVGDVLVSKINPRINRVWIVDESSVDGETIASSEWIVFRASVGLPDFYRIYFSSSTFRDKLVSQVSGVGGSLTRAKPKMVNSYPVPLPPIDEQEQIVEKLTKHLQTIDNAASRVEDLVKSSEEYIAALLRAATDGRISRNWRSEHGTSITDWKRRSFDELGSWGGGGTPKKSVSRYWENGSLRWVTPKDMKQWVIETTQDHVTAAGVSESAAALYQGPAVCIVVRSGILRRALPSAVVDGQFTVNQDMKVLHSVDAAVNIEFIHYYLMAREAQIRTLASKSGTTVESIDFKKLLDLTIDLPSRAEQDYIVERTKELLGFSKQVIELAKQVSDILARSRNRLVTAALAGRLDVSK